MQQLGIPDLTLMDGERIEASLGLEDGRTGLPPGEKDALLLTGRRIIHLHMEGRGQRAVFVSLQDIDAAEIRTEGIGIGGYVWGGLAFAVAAMLWQIWDNPLSLLGAVVVAAMGVYLIVDHRLTPGRMLATFKAGSATVECEVKGRASRQVYSFVDRLFHLKERGDGAVEAEVEPPPARRIFSPR